MATDGSMGGTEFDLHVEQPQVIVFTPQTRVLTRPRSSPTLRLIGGANPIL